MTSTVIASKTGSNHGAAARAKVDAAASAAAHNAKVAGSYLKGLFAGFIKPSTETVESQPKATKPRARRSSSK